MQFNFFRKPASPALVNAPATTASRHQIVDINGKKFVSHLHWYSLTDVTGYMSEARKWGLDNDCDIVTIRRSARIQAGFVRKGAGAVKGMYSLASALAFVLGDSWCGAFKLNDGRYVVVAMSESMVAPGFDMIGDAAAAKRKLGDAIAKFEYPTESVFAPPEFEQGGKEHDIYELLRPSALHRSVQLSPLRFGLTKQQIKVIGATALIGTAAIGGLAAWRIHADSVYQKSIQAAKDASAKELARINATARRRLVEAALAHPWAREPNPVDFMHDCQAAVDALPISLVGWVFTKSDCTASAVAVAYTRGIGATQNDFYKAAQKYARSPIVFPDAKTGAFAIPLNLPAAGDDQIIDTDVLARGFASYFQRLTLKDLNVTTTEVPVKLSVPKTSAFPGATAIKLPDPTWRQVSYTVEGVPIEPSVFLAGLSAQPGIRITKITTSLAEAELTWTIQGNLYGTK